MYCKCTKCGNILVTAKTLRPIRCPACNCYNTLIEILPPEQIIGQKRRLPFRDDQIRKKRKLGDVQQPESEHFIEPRPGPTYNNQYSQQSFQYQQGGTNSYAGPYDNVNFFANHYPQQPQENIGSQHGNRQVEMIVGPRSQDSVIAGGPGNNYQSRKDKDTVLPTGQPAGKVVRSRRKSKGSHKIYECDLCNKVFYSGKFMEHMLKVHDIIKPFKCTHCHKAFAQSVYLTKHERIHTGEKPYKCKHCGKSFTTFSARTVHERTHTGEKPYKCKYCHKKFAHSSSLVSHRRTHTGEKPCK